MKLYWELQSQDQIGKRKYFAMTQFLNSNFVKGNPNNQNKKGNFQLFQNPVKFFGH